MYQSRLAFRAGHSQPQSRRTINLTTARARTRARASSLPEPARAAHSTAHKTGIRIRTRIANVLQGWPSEDAKQNFSRRSSAPEIARLVPSRIAHEPCARAGLLDYQASKSLIGVHTSIARRMSVFRFALRRDPYVVSSVEYR